MKKVGSIFSAPIWLVVIILIAAFFRLYNLESSLMFQGDQGRDAIIVADIFRQRDPVFIGPVTSVGNMYLGPLYYYFMLPWLWLSYPNPAGPAYAVAILGILTVWLVYKLGRKMVGKTAAMLAAIFLAISSTAIEYTRFSWNPNPAPLVSLVMIYATFQAWKKDARWWLVVTTCFAILLQLHYLAALSAGGAGLIWLYAAWEKRKQKKELMTQLKVSLLSLVLLAASFTPLILFDSKHEWLNATAFRKLIFEERNFKTKAPGNTTQKIAQTAKETHGRAMHVLFEISIGQQRELNTFLTLLAIGILGWLILIKRQDENWAGHTVVGAYLLTGIIGTSLYEHTIFDHYIAYLFPITFLTYGIILASWWQKKLWGKTIVIAAVVGFSAYNLPRIPTHDAGWQISDMSAVSQEVYQLVEPGEKYNIVLLSESKDHYGQNYRYFLTTTDRPPVMAGSVEPVEKLIIIDELSTPDPTTSDIYDIVIFPDKEVDRLVELEQGPRLFVLNSNQAN